MEEIEKEAKTLGWSPKEEFRGDPEKWVDAETYVKRGKETLPILKENLERLTKKFESLEAARQQDKKTFEQFREFATKAEERAYKQAEENYKKDLASLKKELKSAAKEGDEGEIDRIASSIDSLKPPDPPKKEPPKPDEAPEFIDWKTRNSWYGTDPERTIYADSVATFVASTNPTLKGAEFFDTVGKHVKEKFPDKFENQKKNTPPAAEGGGEPPPPKDPGKRTFADLPKEGKDAYNYFKSIMPNYTKEEYLSQYNWNEEARR